MFAARFYSPSIRSRQGPAVIFVLMGAPVSGGAPLDLMGATLVDLWGSGAEIPDEIVVV